MVAHHWWSCDTFQMCWSSFHMLVQEEKAILPDFVCSFLFLGFHFSFSCTQIWTGHTFSRCWFLFFIYSATKYIIVCRIGPLFPEFDQFLPSLLVQSLYDFVVNVLIRFQPSFVTYLLDLYWVGMRQYHLC